MPLSRVDKLVCCGSVSLRRAQWVCAMQHPLSVMVALFASSCFRAWTGLRALQVLGFALSTTLRMPAMYVLCVVHETWLVTMAAHVAHSCLEVTSDSSPLPPLLASSLPGG